MSFKRIVYDSSPSILKRHLLKLNRNLFMCKIFFKSFKNRLAFQISLPGKAKNENILLICLIVSIIENS